jgi:hypothetical protein
MLMFGIYLCFYNILVFKSRWKGGARKARGAYFPHRWALMSGLLGFYDFIHQVTRETIQRGMSLKRHNTVWSSLVT